MIYCYGACNEDKPCEEKCNLSLVEYASEYSEHISFIIGIGEHPSKCKRDNPNFKVMNKQELLSMYHKIPIYKRTSQGLHYVYTMMKLHGLVE